MPSIKKNFLYSGILTSANFLFPLITFPYVSRVLGPNNLGIVNFVDGIISYFVLFSMLGVTTIGIREISKNRNDKQKLSEVFSSLVAITGLTTIVAIIVLVICIYAIPNFSDKKEVMFCGMLRLAFNFLLIEWFYKGLENFRYITLRALLVRLAYVIAIFIFVRNAESYTEYYLCLVAMTVVNALINFAYSKKFVRFSFQNLQIKKYIKPSLVLLGYGLLTSLYTTFNIAYLGFVSTDAQVGYYTTATKLYSICIALFTAFTGVMLPRMSHIISTGDKEHFKTLIKKSNEALLSFTIPVIFFAAYFAEEIILLISGPAYGGAVLPFRIVLPLVFIIGYEQILVIQTLMPLGKDRIILRNSIVGALVGVGLNIILVKTLQANGSAITWLGAEVAILVLSQIAVSSNLKINFPFKDLAKSLLYYLPLFLIFVVFTYFIDNEYIRLVAGAILLTIYFFIYQLLFLKDGIVLNTLKSLYRR